MGNGRYPHELFNVALAAIGLLCAFAAAARAQAAPTRRRFLGEVIPGFGGVALTAISLGTPLGLAAGLVLLATASAMIACLALLPDQAGIGSLVTIAAAVGLPPGLAFGGRVVGIVASFEAGDFIGLIGLGAAVTWATWMVAGSRAIGLPGGRGHPLVETFPKISLAIALLTLVAGPALALFQAGFANPVAAEVMPGSASLSGGFASIVTVSSSLPVVTLLVPLLIFGAIAYAVAGVSAIKAQAHPPLFKVPAAASIESMRAAFRSLRVPEQYRSILNIKELELAASGANPVLWLGALVAIGFAVTWKP
jgi:hypothetical protein